MVAHGVVKEGVIVLSDCVHLEEGQQVTVHAQEPADKPSHGILDIPTVSLGAVISEDHDLLGEMLEDRR